MRSALISSAPDWLIEPANDMGASGLLDGHRFTGDAGFINE